MLPSLHATSKLAKAVMLLVVWSVAALESLAASISPQPDEARWLQLLLVLFSEPGTSPSANNSMSDEVVNLAADQLP